MGVAGLTLARSPLLAACTSSTKRSASPGALDFQLSWIKDVSFAGEYFAETNGHYKQVGFDAVHLLSGGADVHQDAIVESGKAIGCISSPELTAAAILNGADLVAIGAQYQKNPFCVMSLAAKPINTPQDMIGKKIGVQLTNETLWKSFITANGIDASSITEVPVGFDPLPLTTGSVDGWFSFVTNEPNVLKSKGFDTSVLMLHDHGYPLVSEIYVVRRASLTGDRSAVKAMMHADIMGWHDAIRDPAAGAELTVSKYGQDLGLDLAQQTLSSKSQNELIVTDDVRANGLFTVSDTLIDETIATCKLGGIDIAKDRLFDMSVLREVYAENPALKVLPS